MAHRLHLFSATALCALLAACGGGGSDDSGDHFIRKGQIWEAKRPADTAASLCYDFDTQQEVADCSGTAWDIKYTFTAQSYVGYFYTNSGPSGEGQGGAYGPPTQAWDELQKITDASTLDAARFTPDTTQGERTVSMLNVIPTDADKVLADGGHDFGWFMVKFADGGSITPQREHGTLLRGGEGNSYARVHLLSMEKTAEGTQVLKFEFDVQPAR